MTRCASPAHSCSGASSGITRMPMTGLLRSMRIPASPTGIASLRNSARFASANEITRSASALEVKNVIPAIMCPPWSLVTPAASSRIGNAAAVSSPRPLTRNSAEPTTPGFDEYKTPYSPTANAIVSTPNTAKFTLWIQPFGPAARALTGSLIGLYSSIRKSSWTTQARVNNTGPISPAQAARVSQDVCVGSVVVIAVASRGCLDGDDRSARAGVLAGELQGLRYWQGRAAWRTRPPQPG